MKEKEASPALTPLGVFPFHFSNFQPLLPPGQSKRERTVTLWTELKQQLSPPQRSTPPIFQIPKGVVQVLAGNTAVVGWGLRVQAGKAKPRETHKTYEGWWHHGGPRWEGGRRCWGPGTRIGNRLLRERKVIGPRMGTEMDFCRREAEG